MIRDPETATIWLIRGGDGHRLVPAFLETGVVGVPFPEILDGTDVDLATAVRRLAAAGVTTKVEAKASMFCSFVRGIDRDDLVVMPDPAMSGLAVGWVEGPYFYDETLPERDCRHRRRVQWAVRLPASALPERLAGFAAPRDPLAKVGEGVVRRVIGEALEGDGEDPHDRARARPVRATGSPSATRQRRPRTPPKPTVEERTCVGCMMTKRAELFDGDAQWCRDCV